MTSEEYVEPTFIIEERFVLGPCKNKGEADHCDGKNNYLQCPIKTAFFSLVALYDGEKYYEKEGKEGDSCPEYVIWEIPYKIAMKEHIAIKDGKRLDGFEPGKRGSCFSLTVESTEPELLGTYYKLFTLVKKGNEKIIEYMKKELLADEDIRKKILEIAGKKNGARFKG